MTDDKDDVQTLQRKLSEYRAHYKTVSDAHEAAELRIVELRAIIARVEALPAKWLSEQTYRREGDCAAELEAALRG